MSQEKISAVFEGFSPCDTTCHSVRNDRFQNFLWQPTKPNWLTQTVHVLISKYGKWNEVNIHEKFNLQGQRIWEIKGHCNRADSGGSLWLYIRFRLSSIINQLIFQKINIASILGETYWWNRKDIGLSSLFYLAESRHQQTRLCQGCQVR